MRLWSLTLGVSLTHVAVLWGVTQWNPQAQKLQLWNDPTFTHQIGLNNTAPAPVAVPAQQEAATPLSTIGQALQVRTLAHSPPPVEQIVQAALASPPPDHELRPTAPVKAARPVATTAHVVPHQKPAASDEIAAVEPDKAMEATRSASLAENVPLPLEISMPQTGATPTSVETAVVAVTDKNEASKVDVALENKSNQAPEKEVPPPANMDAMDVAAAAVAHWPPATRLNYKLHGHYRGDLYGKATVQWQRQGPRYQAQVDVHVSLLFGMRMTSQGRVLPQALWPEVYEEERRGKVRGIKMGDAVVQLNNGETAPRPKNLQDTTSQFVQLAQDFAHQRRPLQVGAVIAVPLARPGGVDEWVYDVVALDTLNTPLGAVPAFHLQPRPLAKARSGVDADMWFAPSLQYLPARIRLNLGPDVWLDLLLESIDQAQASTGKA
jgi:hypothetical protein